MSKKAITSKNSDLIAFDFDNTIVDSSKCKYQLYLEVFKKFGRNIPWSSQKSFREWYYQDNHKTRKTFSNMEEQYMRKCFGTMSYEHPSIPDKNLNEILEWLKDLPNKKLVIISHNESSYIDYILKGNQSINHFNGIFGIDNLQNKKGSTRTFQEVKERLGIKTKKQIYVGDEISDYNFAKDNKATPIIINPYLTRKDLIGGILIKGIRELKPTLEKVLENGI